MQRRDLLGTALAASTLIILPGAAGFAKLTKQRGLSLHELVALGTPPHTELSHNPQRLMAFTVLPHRLSVKAWTDDTYRLKILRTPHTELHRYWGSIINDMEINIYEDSESIKHFTIPWVSNAIIQKKRRPLSQLLAIETGNDCVCEHFLPPDVLAKAILDRRYARLLSESPNRILANEGYTPPSFRSRILHNSPSTYHIPLRQNSFPTFDLEDIDERIYKLAQSTKCCASGTCDISVCY